MCDNQYKIYREQLACSVVGEKHAYSAIGFV